MPRMASPLSSIPPLLPTPRRTRPRTGHFALHHDIPIVLADRASDADFRSALALREALEARSGIRLPIEGHVRGDDLKPRIELHREKELGQSYKLKARPLTVSVWGDGAAGLRYGVETLARLVLPGAKRIPACDITDRPDFEKRGLLLDISRGKVPTLETLREVVDRMVGLKLNLLMLYTEHVFQFRRHPEIGEYASRMNAADVRALDLYAAERHVELVPTLQSLGHMHQLLKIPRYRHLAESDKMWSISPALEATYDLLADLYSEYLPNFRSDWVNANCDEPVDLGRGKSKGWAEKKGRGAVYRYHLERVQKIARSLGRQTMVWGDVVHEHPEQIPFLNKKLVLLDWWYEANHDFNRVKAFARHEIAFMVCPGTSSWNTLFPRVGNAVANIRGYAEAGKRFGAQGLINTDWGDGGHYNLLGNSFFSIAWGAQAAWGATDISPRAFEKAFSLHFFGDRSGVVGKLCRRLGTLHRTGFKHFNNSPLKSVYFDAVADDSFVSRIKPTVLSKTLAALEEVKRDFLTNASKLDGDRTTAEEMRLAIDASIFAARKGLTAYEYLQWKKGERARNSAGRQRLAADLEKLSSEQTKLRRVHRTLWLARNHLSNFEITARYYTRSIRSLRRAARRLTT